MHPSTCHRTRRTTRLVVCLILLQLVGTLATAADRTLDQRRAHVESLSSQEKEKLRRNFQRFMQLDPEQREQLRQLHARIAQSPNRERLLAVMQQYHQWTQSLTAGERMQLANLPVDQRVRAIKKLIERQERDQFQTLVQKTLSLEDREAIIDWLAELAMRRLPYGEQQRLRAIDQPMRRRMEIMAMFRRRSAGMFDSRFLDRLKPNAQDREALAQKLSPQAQATIAAAKGDPEKIKLVQSWVSAAIFSRRGNRPDISPEVLEAFFRQLDPAEKDYLNNLPPDRKREELEQLFIRNRMRRMGDPRPPNSRPRNGLD